MFLSRLTDDALSSDRQRLAQCLHAMISALDRQFTPGASGIPLGNTAAHYSPGIAAMEGLSRVLRGLFPLLAGGDESPFSDNYFDAIHHGTDPQHPGYWGEVRPYDQRLVEMAVYGLGLALLRDEVLRRFSQREQQNLFRWLDQITQAEYRTATGTILPSWYSSVSNGPVYLGIQR